MAKSFSKIWIHVIWSTKKRNPCLTESVRYQLFRHLMMITRDKKFHLDIINGVEDHVHCLIGLNANQNVSEIVQFLKGVSSNWINREGFFCDQFYWQQGYSAFSVSPDNIHKVRKYIYNQVRHHYHIRYQDELDAIHEMAH